MSRRPALTPPIALSAAPARRRGRRPRSLGDTREAIRSSARELFARYGLERTSLRAIARGAGVDPALVLHYFGGKEPLFVDLLRTSVHHRVHALLPPGPLPPRLGEEVVRAFVSYWDARGGEFAALVRSVGADPRTARSIRTLLQQEIAGPLAARVPAGTLPSRLGLAATQLLGIGFARYVLVIDPIAGATPEWLAEKVGPTIDRYLGAPAVPRRGRRGRLRSSVESAPEPARTTAPPPR